MQNPAKSGMPFGSSRWLRYRSHTEELARRGGFCDTAGLAGYRCGVVATLGAPPASLLSSIQLHYPVDPIHDGPLASSKQIVYCRPRRRYQPFASRSGKRSSYPSLASALLEK